jgi:hypothetical protein
LTKVKVLFELESGDWHGHGDETLWAELVGSSDGRAFRLLNSPFFARGDLDDVVDILKRGEADKVWMFQEGCAHTAHLKQRD